jgi:hypothetical protein
VKFLESWLLAFGWTLLFTGTLVAPFVLASAGYPALGILAFVVGAATIVATILNA